MPHRQAPSRSLTFAVHGSAEPESLASAVRAATWELDEALPVGAVGTLREAVRRTLAPRRLTASLSAGFALLAAALAGSPPPPPRASPPRRQHTDPFAPSTLPPAQALGATPPMGRPSSGSTSLEDE